MSADNFDNHFREKLSGHKSAVDGSALWKGVNAGLSGRRKPAAFWWTAVVLILVSAGGLYFGLSPKNQGPEAVQMTETLHMSEKTEDEQAGPPSNQSESLEALPPGARVSPTEAATAGSENKPIDTRNRATENPSVRKVAAAEAGQAPFSGKEKTAENRNTTTSRSASEAERIPSDVNDSDEVNTNEQPLSKENKAAESKSTTAAENSAADDARSDSRESMAALPDIFRKEMTLAEMRPIAALPPPRVLPQMLGELAESLPASYPQSGNRRFFVQFDAGGGILQREIVSRHDDFRDLTRQRNNTERPLEYLNAQLTFGMRFDNGLFWRSGISITRFNEHFSLNRTRTFTDESEVLSHVHVNAAGDSIFTYTPATHTTVIREEVSHFNTYTLVDIPLFAGYDRDFGAWSFGIEAGALLNLTMEARGAMISPADDVIRMEDSGMFRERVNWSAAANLRIGRRVSERLLLRVSPGIRVMPGSVLSVSVMDQHYTLFGGTFGVEYVF